MEDEEEKLDIKKGAIVLFKSIKRKINIDLEDALRIDISLDIKGSIDEYIKDIDLRDPEKNQSLRTQLQKQLKEIA